ncbi:MAG: PIG-L family deacetylase [Roseiarcus sp.]|jgi:LmbE family N-acetylglucosaminyl deacetylase
MGELIATALPEPSAAIFLLAHPDDEFGVFFAIEQSVRQGAEVLCLYFTDGAFRGQRSNRREAESRHVLRRLGVQQENVHFIGGRAGFRDGELHGRLDDALMAVAAILDPYPHIDAICMHAWEGGHQDHDAVHLIAAVYAARRGLLGVCRQFMLYRATDTMLKMALCAPLAENGTVRSEPIPWASRFRYLGLCLNYRSQWKTFSVLLPMLALSYAVKGRQETQSLSLLRLSARPHPGPLLYERRGRATYDRFRAAADQFLRSRIPATPMEKEG